MNFLKRLFVFLIFFIFSLVPGSFIQTSLGSPMSASLKVIAQEETSSKAKSLLLVNAWLIDGTGAPVLEDAWVHVQGGRIVAIGKGEPVSAPEAQRIDLKGKTVIPGLSDMHAHLGTSDRARWILKTLLAYGITTVRDTGNEIGHIAAIRRELAGKEAVPAVYFGGPMMNGSFAERRFLKEGKALQMQLEELTAFGLNFLKHHHWVTTTAVEQIVRHAEQHGLYVVGHVPMTMTSVAAIDHGVRVIEHIRMLPSEVLDDPEVIARYPIDIPFMRRKHYWAHFDPNGRAVKRTLDAWEKRKHKFFIDPTLVIEEVTGARYHPDHPEDPNFSLLSPGTRKRWKNTPSTKWGVLSKQEIAQNQSVVDGMKIFMGMAYARGVRILTGSDVLMAGVVPGPSLHRELELLVEGGLSPVEAIHCSTGLAAESLRVTDRGLIKAGQIADLVVVNGNLAKDITLLDQIEQIVLSGRLYRPDQFLDEAARLAAMQTEPNLFHPF